MKNKLFILFVIIFLIIFMPMAEVFNFDITEIQISENGNKFIGSKEEQSNLKTVY